MVEKRTDNLFLLKIITYVFTIPVSFAHIAAMSRLGFETQCSETETETRLWGYETETQPRLRKTGLKTSRYLETCFEVSISTR